VRPSGPSLRQSLLRCPLQTQQTLHPAVPHNTTDRMSPECAAVPTMSQVESGTRTVSSSGTVPIASPPTHAMSQYSGRLKPCVVVDCEIAVVQLERRKLTLHDPGSHLWVLKVEHAHLLTYLRERFDAMEVRPKLSGEAA